MAIQSKATSDARAPPCLVKSATKALRPSFRSTTASPSMSASYRLRDPQRGGSGDPRNDVRGLRAGDAIPVRGADMLEPMLPARASSASPSSRRAGPVPCLRPSPSSRSVARTRVIARRHAGSGPIALGVDANRFRESPHAQGPVIRAYSENEALETRRPAVRAGRCPRQDSGRSEDGSG